MVAKQNQGAGSLASLAAWLAVPRGLTLFVLLALGAAIAQLLWLRIDSVKVLAWLSGMASPFCMLCAAAVWAMRDKADLAFLNDALSAEQYKNASRLERRLRGHSTMLAAFTSLAALFAAMPAVSNQLIGPIWQPMVLVGGAGVGFAIYAYLIANYWDHQLRAHRSQETYKRKRLDELAKLVEDGEREATSEPGRLLPSWIDGPPLRGPSQEH